MEHAGLAHRVDIDRDAALGWEAPFENQPRQRVLDPLLDRALERPAALEELAKVGFDPVFGARPLKRAIQQRIENPLSRLILEGRFPPKSSIPVDVDPVREPGVFHFGAPQPLAEETAA